MKPPNISITVKAKVPMMVEVTIVWKYEAIKWYRDSDI